MFFLLEKEVFSDACIERDSMPECSKGNCNVNDTLCSEDADDCEHDEEVAANECGDNSTKRYVMIFKCFLRV